VGLGAVTSGSTERVRDGVDVSKDEKAHADLIGKLMDKYSQPECSEFGISIRSWLSRGRQEISRRTGGTFIARLLGLDNWPWWYLGGR